MEPASARRAVGRFAAGYAFTRHVVWVIDGALVTDEAGERSELLTGGCLAGVIPDYAFKPRGGLTGRAIYFKLIGQTAD